MTRADRRRELRKMQHRAPGKKGRRPSVRAAPRTPEADETQSELASAGFVIARPTLKEVGRQVAMRDLRELVVPQIILPNGVKL